MGSCVYDAISTMSMKIVARMPVAWIVRRDEYGVDEDGSVDAGGVDDSKTRRVHMMKGEEKRVELRPCHSILTSRAVVSRAIGKHWY